MAEAVTFEDPKGTPIDLYAEYKFAKQDGITLDGPISANGDAATQASQLQTCINQKVNALLVNPVDSAAISTTSSAHTNRGASKSAMKKRMDVAPIPKVAPAPSISVITAHRGLAPTRQSSGRRMAAQPMAIARSR